MKKKIENIDFNHIKENNEGILVNEKTGNSFAWDILQYVGKITRRMITANIIEAIVILILVVIIFFKL